MRFGPNRQAAYLERREGYCCICDIRPIRAPGTRHYRDPGSRYTCGAGECTAAWGRLCQLDYRHAERGAPKSLERDRPVEAETGLGCVGGGGALSLAAARALPPVYTTPTQ